MAVWAIGDIQGCFDSLKALLEKVAFDPQKDRLWLVGDLVNRGQGSLETLEYLYGIKESVDIVLGNHDITLIAAYYGIKKSNPTIDPILDSPEAKKLIEWLQEQKFLHVDYKLGYCMAHAGISPEFDLGMAIRYAGYLETRLQSADAPIWLEKMFKKGVSRFDRKADIIDIDRYLMSSFTRMRFCFNDHRLDFDQKGSPSEELKAKGMSPWFLTSYRKEIDLKIIFGHWAALGYYQDEHVLALDTGCIWGGKLTAARLDMPEPMIVQVECPKASKTSGLSLSDN
ncbi:MAG: symmetrical bis(5'-nucleosyl)-tetraphosphatase [Campylobacterales bacterium]|nr:symmetrical bis(5'-nucleosyl)-tetraphosphatase [Campylobacterales bacterium]